MRNGPILIREMLKADAVHALVPGDIGTIGMIVALTMKKPLLVRHCGNWFVQQTFAEHFWKWFMERFAGGKNVMLATGGASEPPSQTNSAIQWIFSTTLTKDELTISSLNGDSSHRKRSRLIIVCRQEERKGTSSVIKSLPLIRKFLPTVTLDVVGTGTEMERLRRLTEELHLTKEVTFHGQVDHSLVLRLLSRSDLFCYPTTSSEGFPKAVLEALAMGLPVITTRVSVLPQLMNTGCGLVIDSVAPEAIAEAAGEILLDSRQYSAMSKQAVQTARAYSLEEWRDGIAALLQRAWGPLRSHA
jgi:glycosyltransferase involved in cell wall biosynthesis